MSDTSPRPRRAVRRDSWTRGPGSASARLARGIAVPQTRTSFRLSPEARVFHIGDDFARILAASQRAQGAQVASLPGPGSPAEFAEPGGAALLDLPGPEQIRQELEWAAGTRRFAEEALVPVADDWMDPFLGPAAATGPLAMIRGRRRALAAHFSRALRTDLVVVTLSRTETWYDKRTRLAINDAPDARARRADPERFAMRRLTYDEVLPVVKAICTLLRRQRDELKIVLAVSPIPVPRTWTGEDVIVANMAAKSALHAAATTIASANEGVDYFPAYETFMTADPEIAWESDRRTPRPKALATAARALMDAYGLHLAAGSRTLGTA